MAIKRDPSAGTYLSVDVSLGWVTLYLDDVDGLLEFLRPRAGKVTLHAGEQSTLDSADDLPGALRDELGRLKIEMSDPLFTVYLEPDRLRLRSIDRSDKAKALGTDIGQYLAQHASSRWDKWKAALRLSVFAIPMLVILAIGVAIGIGVVSGSDPIFVVINAISSSILASLIYWCVSRMGLQKSGVILKLETREQARTARTARQWKFWGWLGGTLVSSGLSGYVGFLVGLANPK